MNILEKADREKAVNGLTECIHLYEYPDDWGSAGCVVCPYRPNGKGTCNTTIPIQLLKDALELLKEQESIEPKQQEETRVWTVCGNCSQHLIGKWIYCPNCGRKVKWDAETSS